MLPSERDTAAVKARDGTRGHPGPIYETFAQLVTGVLSHKLKPGEVVTPSDCGHIQICLKQARDIRGLGAYEDDLVDIAGYADVIYRVREERSEV
jgi:hypothetical protein